MEKGIIVVDIPEKCEDCVLSNPDGDYCPFHGAVSYPEYDSKKPNDCPIKPLPMKNEVMKLPRIRTMNDLKRIGFQEGWNACVERILNEKVC